MADQAPQCPGCRGRYDRKVPTSTFDIGELDDDDSYCREAGYVHIHEQSTVGQESV